MRRVWHRYSPLFWLGDQMTTWDAHDGIASALTATLSGGMSGFALTHSDVGGYTGVDLKLGSVPIKQARAATDSHRQSPTVTDSHRQ